MKRVFIGIGLSIILLTTLACQFSAGQTTIPTPTVRSIPTYDAPSQTILIPGADPGDLHERDVVLTTLYENVNPGVVTIRNFSTTAGSEGSGFVFDTAGHIVTNYHVVKGADDLEVDFPSGFKTHAEVIGTCLLYTSDAADDLPCVDLGGRRIIKKKKKHIR